MRTHPRRFVFTWLLGILGLVVTACSGGSGGGASGGVTSGKNLDLLLDTAAESDARITGRLAVVALETVDGKLSPNLVDEGTEITLADPFGELAGLALRDAPAGVYVAVNLLFFDEFVTALLADGNQVAVKLSRRDFRVPFAKPFALTAGPQSWFTLRHDGPIVFEQVGSGLLWTPKWLAEPAEAELVRGVEVRVVKIDARSFRVDAELVGLGGLLANLDFSRAETLLRDDRELTRELFFAALKSGESLRIDGWLESWRSIRVIAARVDSDADHGQKSEVRGEIVEVRPRDMAFVLRVIEIVKDRAGLPVSRPLRLVVVVDAKTAIQWVPRHGRHPGHLPYPALQVGMLVDVEWFGPARDLTVTAKKIDIHAEKGQDTCRVVEGEVQSIDLVRKEFVLAAHGHGSFRLGGGSYATLRVTVDAGTVIVQKDRGEMRVVGLDALKVGARVHASVDLEGAGSARGCFVRID